MPQSRKKRARRKRRVKNKQFSDLRTDDLAMPPIDEVLENLEIRGHAQERFQERSGSEEKLSKEMIAKASSKPRLSRRSPPWRLEEDAHISPDFYLLFSFPWQDGREDEGCLLIRYEEDMLFGQKHISFQAVTFLSRLFNEAQKTINLPPPPGKLSHLVAEKEGCSAEEAKGLLAEGKLQSKKPQWLSERADAWIVSSRWAVGLQRATMGPGNPYHYSWGDFYDRALASKNRSRERYQRMRRRKTRH